MDARELEVRCEWCDAGFAAGTRTCIHCGHALGRARPAADAPTLFGSGGDEADAEESAGGSFWGNVVPGVIAIVFVVLSYVLKSCDR